MTPCRKTESTQNNGPCALSFLRSDYRSNNIQSAIPIHWTIRSSWGGLRKLRDKFDTKRMHRYSCIVLLHLLTPYTPWTCRCQQAIHYLLEFVCITASIGFYSWSRYSMQKSSWVTFILYRKHIQSSHSVCFAVRTLRDFLLLVILPQGNNTFAVPWDKLTYGQHLYLLGPIAGSVLAGITLSRYFPDEDMAWRSCRKRKWGDQ